MAVNLMALLRRFRKPVSGALDPQMNPASNSQRRVGEYTLHRCGAWLD
jgi:hypothetical protein